ncbi:50S ribosomal protein L4 [Patescibacteria group bacterium]
MSKVKVYNFKGEELKDIKLSEDIFGVKSNNDLVHQVYVALMANQRQSNAHTKNRAERTGSGRKPWKQKGTGRARTGSVKNPIWRKGGVIFGPTNERNYTKKINKKVNTIAIKTVLSEKARSESIVIFDKIESKNVKTKDIANALNKVGVLGGSTLLVLDKDEKDAFMYSRNIEKVNVVPADSLNVMDMLNNKSLVLSEGSIKHLEDKYKK